jgi:hypothetical protein
MMTAAVSGITSDERNCFDQTRHEVVLVIFLTLPAGAQKVPVPDDIQINRF